VPPLFLDAPIIEATGSACFDNPMSEC
jgi:hypothetical protein